MPRGDGTGPTGQGPGTGRGMGRGRGAGKGTGRNADGGRIGRMGGTKRGAGPSGQCVCPSCGATSQHQIGVPCYSMKCSKCGAAMARR